MKSLRFLPLALVCMPSIASRPESDEVHIATNGHFVRAKLSLDRDDELAHRTTHHLKAAEGTSRSQVAIPHHTREAEVHERNRTEHNSSGAPEQNISVSDGSQRRIHMSTALHEESKRYEKVLMDAIMQRESKLNASVWAMDNHGDYQGATRSWNDCLPYLVTRVFIIALIIYTFMRNHLSQPLQEINDYVVKQHHHQEVNVLAAACRESMRQPTSEPQGAVNKCQQAGESIDKEQNQEGRAQPVEERLGKAIEDSLSDVEEWLRSEAEVDEGVVPHYDIATPRGGSPAPSEQEPSLQRYQRRGFPGVAKAARSAAPAIG
jgi:hypothetical protein